MTEMHSDEREALKKANQILHAILTNRNAQIRELQQDLRDVAQLLNKRLYALSEPHQGGYRLVLGFETLAEAQAAHSAIADIAIGANK